jgi:hypothetical protein
VFRASLRAGAAHIVHLGSICVGSAGHSVTATLKLVQERGETFRDRLVDGIVLGPEPLPDFPQPRPSGQDVATFELTSGGALRWTRRLAVAIVPGLKRRQCQPRISRFAFRRPASAVCMHRAFSTQGRGAMRSFGIAIVVAVVLAIGFAVMLNANQKTAQEEFSTEAVRL